MYRTLSAAQSRLFWRLNKTLKTTFDSSLHPQRFFQQNWRSCSSDKVGLAECAWTWQCREAYSWSSCSGSTNAPGWSWKGEMAKKNLPKGLWIRIFDSWLYPLSVNRDQSHWLALHWKIIFKKCVLPKNMGPEPVQMAACLLDHPPQHTSLEGVVGILR